jgi:hypothetical protein
MPTYMPRGGVLVGWVPAFVLLLHNVCIFVCTPDRTPRWNTLLFAGSVVGPEELHTVYQIQSPIRSYVGIAKGCVAGDPRRRLVSSFSQPQLLRTMLIDSVCWLVKGTSKYAKSGVGMRVGRKTAEVEVVFQ